MAEERNKGGSGMPNEGEGSRTGARQYDEATKRFAKSGKVEKKAREARDAVEGEEGKELEKAEAEGKRHIAEEDPALKKR